MSEFKPEIVWRNPSDLTPYAKNTRKHSQRQIEKLAGAIAEFDFDQPIVVDAKGIVVKGHGRREAAIRLGLKSVPVIVRADLSPAQIKAARLADNRIAAEGVDDFEAISLEIEELSDLGFDLHYTGFDEAEIDKFLSDSAAEVDYQPSQVFGGGYEGMSHRDQDDEEEGGSEPEPEPQEANEREPFKPPSEKYPLAIVLSAAQKQHWDDVKAVLGIKSDTQAFLKLIGEIG